MTESQSPRWCHSTQDYNEYTNNHYHNIDDVESIIPDWFFPTYCDECKKYTESTNNIKSQHLSHKILITCNYCQNILKTFNSTELRC